MRFLLAAAAIAAAMTVPPAAAAATPPEPEAITARPADTDRARGYWTIGRMEGAAEVLPVVLDPVTLEPVAAG